MNSFSFAMSGDIFISLYFWMITLPSSVFFIGNFFFLSVFLLYCATLFQPKFLLKIYW